MGTGLPTSLFSNGFFPLPRPKSVSRMKSRMKSRVKSRMKSRMKKRAKKRARQAPLYRP